MSRQQRIFDWVVAHLTNQAAPSLSGSSCVYRAGDNSKACAVGCLITDAMYYSTEKPPIAPLADVVRHPGAATLGGKIEDSSSSNELVQFMVSQSLGFTLQPENMVLLGELQSAHDSQAGIVTRKQWRQFLLNRLHKIASRRNLKTTQLDYMQARFKQLNKE